MSEAMTLNDAADLYDERNSGRAARTLPIETVIAWLKTQRDVRYDEARDLFYHDTDATERHNRES